MNPQVRKIVEASGRGWAEYSDNAWNGADRRLPDGGTLRLAQEGGEGEPVEVFRFDAGMMLQWQASFSASVPVLVVAAAIEEACREGTG
jgi:hypothetical protein